MLVLEIAAGVALGVLVAAGVLFAIVCAVYPLVMDR